MPLVSIVVPTYNEENNVEPLFMKIKNVFEDKLPSYEYEVIFIDNMSLDGTRKKLRRLAADFGCVKCIFNVRNFGQFNSPYYGLLNTNGDCSILLCADFQDPPELIPDFIKYWENGMKIVVGVKKESKESHFMYFLRTVYYKILNISSDIDVIGHFTGFGLYDKDFINILKTIDDPAPFLRGMVSEFGFPYKIVEYIQNKRREGKSSNNFFRLYDAGMLGITSYTKFFIRSASFVGLFICFLSVVFLMVTLFGALVDDISDSYFLHVMFCFLAFITGLQTFFIGILGEYVLNISRKVSKRPLVIEEERINF